MDYAFLERIKSRVISGAQTSAAKLEDAARTGKIHLDLMAARRKLLRAYTELGKETYQALLEDTVTVLARRPGVPVLQAEIEDHKGEIAHLEARLAENKEAKNDKEGADA